MLSPIGAITDADIFASFTLDRDIQLGTADRDKETWLNASTAAAYTQNPRNPLEICIVLF
jgi:hypothetical protein